MILQDNSLTYIGAFLGGMAVSFSPCVYPLIPITAGYIGATAAGSKLKGFLLSLIYVTGIALTYSVLGLIASLSGTFFGKISTHPLTYFLVGGIIILFGISMLDLFPPTPKILVWGLPQLIKLSGPKKKNYFSAFFFGISSGLVVSPCLTPVVGSILLYLTTKKNLFYGATLLLSFAYGMGLILILVGTFSAVLLNLPKLGKWMLYIKKAAAVLLLAMGIYFIFVGAGRCSELAFAQESYAAADFKLPDTKNEMFTLSSYKDKQPVILFFWTTRCPFCVKELKVLNEKYSEFTKNGWELLAIDIGEPLYRVENFLKRYPLNFKVLLDKDTSVAYAYDILGVPTYILVDKKGYIVFEDHRFPEKYKELISE